MCRAQWPYQGRSCKQPGRGALTELLSVAVQVVNLGVGLDDLVDVEVGALQGGSAAREAVSLGSLTSGGQPRFAAQRCTPWPIQPAAPAWARHRVERALVSAPNTRLFRMSRSTPGVRSGWPAPTAGTSPSCEPAAVSDPLSMSLAAASLAGVWPCTQWQAREQLGVGLWCSRIVGQPGNVQCWTRNSPAGPRPVACMLLCHDTSLLSECAGQGLCRYGLQIVVPPQQGSPPGGALG